MLQLSALSSGEKGQFTEFYKTLMSRKPTLETSLDLADFIIISVLSTLGGIFQNMQIRINWDGTSKTVLHGKTQSIIAGKLEDTIILEVRTKRENIEPLFPDQDYLFGIISNTQYVTRMIVKSQYGLTVKVQPERVLGATLCADREELSLYLELKATDTE